MVLELGHVHNWAPRTKSREGKNYINLYNEAHNNGGGGSLLKLDTCPTLVAFK